MSFAAGVNARTQKERLKFDKEQAAQDAKLKRQELAQIRDEQELELIELGYRRDGDGFGVVPNGAADLAQQERNVQMEAIRSLLGRTAAYETYAAIEEFGKDGDANVFQLAMNNNPFLKQAWLERGVHQVANVDFENDGKLLEAVGITQDHINNPKMRHALRRSIWKYYDGKQWNIGFLNQLVAETGALIARGPERCSA